ncbi:MAG: pentapeptide repeat-containing protein [Bacteroidota bacterium]
MARVKAPLVGLFFIAVLSGILTYFCWSYIVRNSSFLLGFATCLLLISMGWGLQVFWSRKAKITTARPLYAGLLTAGLLVLGSMVCALLIVRQSAALEAQDAYQNQRLEQEAALIASADRGHFLLLMRNLLTKVDRELQEGTEGRLQEKTIARIAALSYSLKPYAYVVQGGVAAQKLSPERGQLLLALVNMEIDSSVFAQIKFRTTFAGADLRRADLRATDLSGVNLEGADLVEADLRNSNLEGANLKAANLWGANLRNAKLNRAEAKNAVLSWAEMHAADLRNIDLSGADLTSTKLRKANLNGSKLKFVQMDGAFLNNANLVGADLMWANLRRANLSDANLRKASLKWTTFKETNLYGVTVGQADWMAQLKKWRVKGVSEVETQYQLVEHAAGLANYKLVPLE